MITSKNIDRTVMVIIAIAVLLCLACPLYMFHKDKKNASNVLMEYETAIFDTSKAVEINIVIEPDKWETILENAAKKQWESCDVIVNGTKFSNVAIRTKGANSLEEIARDPDSNRYSFKLEFDKYNKGQSCFGLDKLCLNNNYGDATNMKDALVYDMFQYMDAETPLYNYAKIMINGEYWGVYLAVEAPEDSFLTRNYGSKKGALYKPGGTIGTEDNEFEMEEMMEMEENDSSSEDAYLDGGALNYIDNKLSSYDSIFKCEVNKTSKAEHKKVVKALKNISQKKNLDSYMNIDNILKYMAVHNFSVNYDSLFGDGAHNFYLYESEGKLSLIPWDYNLCLGAYACDISGDFNLDSMSAVEIINKSIDDSWPITSFFDGILENEKYLKQYHQYYQKLIDEYVLGQGFQQFYNNTRNVIDRLVETDPSALYTYQTYDTAAKTLQQVVYLRGQSVNGQLQGTIPSTFSEQSKNKEKLVDCTGINLFLMEGASGMGEGMEDAEWSEADWMSNLKEYMEQQNVLRKSTIRNNIWQFIFYFGGICIASIGVIVWRKRR